MRIAIIMMTGGGLSGGSLKTMHNLIPRMRSHPCVNKAHVFVPQRVAELSCLKEQDIVAWPDRDWMLGFRWLKSEIRKIAPDVVFIPTAARVNFKAIPTVVMVRNAESLLQPFGGNQFHIGLKNLLRRHVARVACEKATRIIAVSQFVHGFLVRKWHIPESKISVVYHGVEQPPPREKTVMPAIMGGQDKHPFLFTGGSLVPYRGLEDIIRSMALLEGLPSTLKLLIAGESLQSNRCEKRLKELAHECGASSRIVWLGHITPKEMSWCFYNCEAFVITSRLEACPNLALEALSHGCLNISSRCPPMPEIFCSGAIYYEAGCPEELAGRITQVVLLTAEEKQRMRMASRDIAKKFSWLITADKIVDNLQYAINHGRKLFESCVDQQSN